MRASVRTAPKISLNRIWCNWHRRLWFVCEHCGSRHESPLAQGRELTRRTPFRGLQRLLTRRGVRGAGTGLDCLLYSGCELWKDLSVYFPFYDDWLKLGSVAEAPWTFTTPRAKKARRKHNNEAVLLTRREICASKGFRIFTASSRDFTKLFTF